MSELKDQEKSWHEAACHCHAVKYKVLLPPLYPPTKTWISKCNCSICSKNGYLIVYPLREEVVFTEGYDKLKDYRFATKTRDHKFCPECGSSILIDYLGKSKRGDVLGINVGGTEALPFVPGLNCDRPEWSRASGWMISILRRLMAGIHYPRSSMKRLLNEPHGRW